MMSYSRKWFLSQFREPLWQVVCFECFIHSNSIGVELLASHHMLYLRCILTMGVIFIFLNNKELSPSDTQPTY